MARVTEMFEAAGGTVLEGVRRPPMMFVTGDSLFNEAGDQTMGHYVFYRVTEEDGSFSWKDCAMFRKEYGLQGIMYR